MEPATATSRVSGQLGRSPPTLSSYFVSPAALRPRAAHARARHSPGAARSARRAYPEAAGVVLFAAEASPSFWSSLTM